jgi:TATA-binding protein-associated factor
MPSQTAAIALIELFFAIPGAPWIWPEWQTVTGVRNGLFPQADGDLPSGWTRADAKDVYSWFLAYDQKGGRESASAMPGRAKWNRFVQTKWEAWGVHETIVRHLRDSGIHPAQVVVNENRFKPWPNADCYVPTIVEPVGADFFGEEALGPRKILTLSARKCLTVFIQRSWARIRVQVNKDEGRLTVLENSARAAFNSTYAFLDDFSGTNLPQSLMKAGSRRPKSSRPSAPFLGGAIYVTYTGRRPTSWPEKA